MHNDAQKILAMELSSNSVDDQMIWKHHRNFTSKSAYASILQSSFQISAIVLNPDVFKILWYLPIIPKWEFFMWKLRYDKMPTKIQFHRRGIPLSPECDCCTQEVETSNRLFRKYTLAYTTWQQIGLITF